MIVPDQRIYEDWKLGVEFWCAVMNMPERYEQMAATYNQRVAELQAALGNPGELEVSVILASTYQHGCRYADSSAGHVLADVGLNRPEAQPLVGEAAMARYGEKQYIEISEERLDLVDGDAIFYFTYAAVDPKVATEHLCSRRSTKSHSGRRSVRSRQATPFSSVATGGARRPICSPTK